MTNNSKKIKVSIQDENTLVLMEDAQKGDTIDLTTIHETDIDKTAITNIVNSIKKDKFEETLKEKISVLQASFAQEQSNKEKEFAILQAKKENEWRENERKKLEEKEREIAELKMKQNTSEMEKKIAISEAMKIIEKERDTLANELKNKELEKELLEKSLLENHKNEIQNKEESFAKEL